MIAPYNPQQNEVVERKNKSIVGEEWEMLHDHGLSLHLWVEACNIIVYLKNRSHYHILRMSTPNKVFSNKKLNVAHIMIIGSLVYYHVTNDAQKKLEPTAELGIFVGYTNTPHNYRVYLTSNRMIVVHRDVKFDEEKAIKIFS